MDIQLHTKLPTKFSEEEKKQRKLKHEDITTTTTLPTELNMSRARELLLWSDNIMIWFIVNVKFKEIKSLPHSLV